MQARDRDNRYGEFLFHFQSGGQLALAALLAIQRKSTPAGVASLALMMLMDSRRGARGDHVVHDQRPASGADQHAASPGPGSLRLKATGTCGRDLRQRRRVAVASAMPLGRTSMSNSVPDQNGRARISATKRKQRRSGIEQAGVEKYGLMRPDLSVNYRSAVRCARWQVRGSRW